MRGWGTTPNGVFAAKLMWDHVERLTALGPLDELFDRPRYVWVRRGDVVRQAVSLWRAMQTQSWRDDSTDGAAGGAVPRYSFAALRHLVRAPDRPRRPLAGPAGRRAGARDHATRSSPPTSRARSGVRSTMSACRCPATRRSRSPPMRRQADELSEAWVAAYARDLEPLTTST